MGESPLISVIIPVYNAELYIEKCITSILNQKLKEIEIICINDGSTDKSKLILKKISFIDSRIKIINQRNLHAGVARNNGLKIAKGEYIHFLDADDWLEEDVYDKWYAVAKKNNADVCKCLYQTFDDTTHKILKRPTELSSYISYPTLLSNTKELCFDDIAPWCKLYKRAFLLKYNILFDNLLLANDRFFYYETILFATRYVIIREWWINYRIKRNNALTGELRLKFYDCHFESFRKISKLIEKCPKKIKKYIVIACIQDFSYFFKKAKNTPYYNEIQAKLYNFFSSYDISDIICEFSPNFLLTYLNIIEKESEKNKDLVVRSLLKLIRNKEQEISGYSHESKKNPIKFKKYFLIKSILNKKNLIKTANSYRTNGLLLTIKKIFMYLRTLS